MSFYSLPSNPMNMMHHPHHQHQQQMMLMNPHYHHVPASSFTHHYHMDYPMRGNIIVSQQSSPLFVNNNSRGKSNRQSDNGLIQPPLLHLSQSMPLHVPPAPLAPAMPVVNAPAQYIYPNPYNNTTFSYQNTHLQTNLHQQQQQHHQHIKEDPSTISSPSCNSDESVNSVPTMDTTTSKKVNAIVVSTIATSGLGDIVSAEVEEADDDKEEDEDYEVSEKNKRSKRKRKVLDDYDGEYVEDGTVEGDDTYDDYDDDDDDHSEKTTKMKKKYELTPASKRKKSRREKDVRNKENKLLLEIASMCGVRNYSNKHVILEEIVKAVAERKMKMLYYQNHYQYQSQQQPEQQLQPPQPSSSAHKLVETSHVVNVAVGDQVTFQEI